MSDNIESRTDKMSPSKPKTEGSPPKKKLTKDETRRAKSKLKDMLEFTKAILKGASISSSPPKSLLRICSKFTGEHPCRSVISIKLQINFVEITLRHGCSPVNLLHIF